MTTNSPSEHGRSPREPRTARTPAVTGRTGQGLPRELRLRRAADFQRVYRRRCRLSDQYLLAYGCENNLPYPRLGLAVNRRVGKAVVRNRWKRLLREAFRQQAALLPAGIDLVLSPHPVSPPPLEILVRALRRLATQLARRLAEQRPDDGHGP